MKRIVISFGIMFLLVLSCTNKQEGAKPKVAQDSLITVIGGKDGTTEIIISDNMKKADADTVIYELPDCQLWYTKELPPIYNEKAICMWTEYKKYWENVSVINVFVANPTHTCWMFGRGWYLRVWDGEKWINPQIRKEFVWLNDGFEIEKAPLLYCFRIPVGEYYYLPKGKYRVTKCFSPRGGGAFDLTAEFEVK